MDEAKVQPYLGDDMTARLIDDVRKLRLEIDVEEDPPEVLDTQWGTKTLTWKRLKVVKGKVIYRPIDVVK